MTAENSSLDADERLALVKWQLEQNRLDRALETLKPLLGADPGDEACLTGARLYAQLRLFERAQALFEQYLKAHPDAAAVRFQLGMTQFESGDNAAALRTWDEVLAGVAEHPPSLFYSAVALLQDGAAGRALERLRRVLQNAPVDNLYYGQARDLIAKVEQDPNHRAGLQTEGDDDAGLRAIAVKDVYKTEH